MSSKTVTKAVNTASSSITAQAHGQESRHELDKQGNNPLHQPIWHSSASVNSSPVPPAQPTTANSGHNFARIPIISPPPGRPPIQAKLTVGEPDDKYEEEADQIADQVMRMPEPTMQGQPEGNDDDETNSNQQTKPLVNEITPLIQRQTGEEDKEDKEEPIQTKSIIQRQSDDENDEEEFIQPKSLIQRREELQEEEMEGEAVQSKSDKANTPRLSHENENYIRSISGQGQPLSRSERHFFESRFGHNFAGVRVHTDGRAARAAREINAQAFTMGDNIFFGENRYQPATPTGRRLLAHELTHTIQQSGKQSLGAGWSHSRSNTDISKASASNSLPASRTSSIPSRPALAISAYPLLNDILSRQPEGERLHVQSEAQGPLTQGHGGTNSPASRDVSTTDVRSAPEPTVPGGTSMRDVSAEIPSASQSTGGEASTEIASPVLEPTTSAPQSSAGVTPGGMEGTASSGMEGAETGIGVTSEPSVTSTSLADYHTLVETRRARILDTADSRRQLVQEFTVAEQARSDDEFFSQLNRLEEIFSIAESRLQDAATSAFENISTDREAKLNTIHNSAIEQIDSVDAALLDQELRLNSAASDNARDAREAGRREAGRVRQGTRENIAAAWALNSQKIHAWRNADRAGEIERALQTITAETTENIRQSGDDAIQAIERDTEALAGKFENELETNLANLTQVRDTAVTSIEQERDESLQAVETASDTAYNQVERAHVDALDQLAGMRGQLVAQLETLRVADISVIDNLLHEADSQIDLQTNAAITELNSAESENEPNFAPLSGLVLREALDEAATELDVAADGFASNLDTMVEGFQTGITGVVDERISQAVDTVDNAAAPIDDIASNFEVFSTGIAADAERQTGEVSEGAEREMLSLASNASDQVRMQVDDFIANWSEQLQIGIDELVRKADQTLAAQAATVRDLGPRLEERANEIENESWFSRAYNVIVGIVEGILERLGQLIIGLVALLVIAILVIVVLVIIGVIVFLVAGPEALLLFILGVLIVAEFIADYAIVLVVVLAVVVIILLVIELYEVFTDPHATDEERGRAIGHAIFDIVTIFFASKLMGWLGKASSRLARLLGLAGDEVRLARLLVIVGGDEARLARLVSAFGDDAARLESVLARLSNSVDDLERLLGIMGDDGFRLERLLGIFSDDVARMETLIGHMGGDATRLETMLVHFEGNISRLETILGNFGNSGARLETALGAFGDDAVRLETALSAFADDGARLEAALGAFADSGLRLETALGAFSNDAMRLETALSAFANNGTRLEAALGAFADNGVRLEAALSAFANDGARLDAVLSAFAENGTRLEAALSAFAENGTRLEAALSAFAENGTRLEAALSAFANDGARLEAALSAFAENGTRLEAALSAFAENGTRLEAALSAFANDGARLEAALSAFSGDGARLETALAAFADDGARLDTALAAFTGNGTRLEAALSTVGNDGARLEARLRAPPRPRVDVRPVPLVATTSGGVDVAIETIRLNHVLEAHTIENFDPVVRAAEIVNEAPTHVTTFFRPGTATNPRELYTLIRQALQGRAGRSVAAGVNNRINLTLRNNPTEAWIGPVAGGGGMRLNSIYPLASTGRNLTAAEIRAYAADIQAGRLTLSQVRAAIAMFLP